MKRREVEHPIKRGVSKVEQEKIKQLLRWTHSSAWTENSVSLVYIEHRPSKSV